MSILNTAPFLEITRDIANETEFELLTGAGANRLDTAMTDCARSKNQTVVVTLGAEGARAATPVGSFRVPSPKVDPVDTVGAGDTFCGLLAHALDHGLDHKAAMWRATTAASLAVLRPGAQPAMPYAAEVETTLETLQPAAGYRG